MIRTFIGFDVGKKRTGVAIGNDVTRIANGLHYYQNHKNGSTNWQAVQEVLDEYRPYAVIVGVPYNADGSTQEMTFIAKSFARKLSERFSIECILVDEFLSSFEAKKQLKYNHYHKNAKRAAVDKKSAEIILQDFLNDL
jgi:putative Holliday junction resolvase